jgi:hypothetical protein
MRTTASWLISTALSLVACTGPMARGGPPRAANDGGSIGAPAKLVYRVPVDGLPSLGSPSALVTLVAFTD